MRGGQKTHKTKSTQCPAVLHQCFLTVSLLAPQDGWVWKEELKTDQIVSRKYHTLTNGQMAWVLKTPLKFKKARGGGGRGKKPSLFEGVVFHSWLFSFQVPNSTLLFSHLILINLTGLWQSLAKSLFSHCECTRDVTIVSLGANGEYCI